MAKRKLIHSWMIGHIGQLNSNLINGTLTELAKKTNSGYNSGTISATATYTMSKSGKIIFVAGNGGMSNPASGGYGMAGSFSANVNGVSIVLNIIGGCAVGYYNAKTADILSITSTINTGSSYVQGGGYVSAGIYLLE